MPGRVDLGDAKIPPTRCKILCISSHPNLLSLKKDSTCSTFSGFTQNKYGKSLYKAITSSLLK